MEVSAEKKTRFDITGNILSPLVVILMGIFWLYPWLIWTREISLFPWDRAPLNIFSLFALFTIPYVISRFIPAGTRLMWWVKFALVVATIGVIINIEYGGGFLIFSGAWLNHITQLLINSFNTLHPIAPALGVAVFLSWRGMNLGSSSTFFHDVYRSFLFGLIAVVLLIIVWAASLGSDPSKSLVSSAGIYLAGFFFFGLTALAMGNFLNIRQKLIRDKSVPLSNRRWFTVLFVVIGGMVLAGVGIASLFSSDFLNDTGSAIGNLVYYLNYGLRYIFIPLGYIIEVIWYVMEFLVNLVKADTTVAEFVFPGFDEIEGLEETPLPTDGFDIMLVLKWIAFLLIVAFAIYLLYKASKRFRAHGADTGIEEYSESLWSWLGFKADIRMFFSRLFARWFGSRVNRIRSGLASLRYPDGNYPDDMDIREIYRHVMEEAATSGHKHHSWETPYEYATRLETAMPGIDEQVDDITDLYVNVRYGESGLKDWETEHANVLFRLLRRVFHRTDSTS